MKVSALWGFTFVLKQVCLHVNRILLVYQHPSPALSHSPDLLTIRLSYLMINSRLSNVGFLLLPRGEDTELGFRNPEFSSQFCY